MKTRIKNTIMYKGKRLVCRIYDLGPEGAFDRYTVAFNGYRHQRHGMIYPYLASSSDPFYGVGFIGESREFLTGKGLGKRVRFEDVPAQVQQFILQSI
jgi:hypothetical protein